MELICFVLRSWTKMTYKLGVPRTIEAHTAFGLVVHFKKFSLHCVVVYLFLWEKILCEDGSLPSRLTAPSLCRRLYLCV